MLQAAKYLTGQPATFEEGDWNYDGVFDQSDIIDVLVADTYELNSMAALRWRDGLNLTFEEAEVPVRYQLYLAPGHDDPNLKRPLILSLHNGSSSGTDNSSHVNRRRFTDLLAKTQTEEFASFLIAPQISVDQARDNGWENPQTLRSLLALVDEVTSTYNVDPQRIYVVGKSMGGWGTYAAVRERPDFFAAAVPIASTVSRSEYTAETVADHIKDVPIWIFHGTADSVMPVSKVREIVEALKAAGGSPRYTETNFDHNSWRTIYNDTRGRIFTDSSSDELFQWLFDQATSARAVAGDANGDGAFNQLDIVQVLQTAKYLTDEPASFDEGDWNNDGFFNQLDIVEALQAGTYLQQGALEVIDLSELVKGVQAAQTAFGDPKVIGTDDALAASIRDIAIRDQISNRIELQTQDLLFFSWSGSGQDKLTFTIDGSVAVFQYAPGLTKDLRPHTALFAINKGGDWRVDETAFD